MKTVIHVNQHVIRSNTKAGRHAPPIAVKTYKGTTYATEVLVLGECRVVYDPDHPLSCGAKCWVETAGQVEVVTRNSEAT